MAKRTTIKVSSSGTPEVDTYVPYSNPSFHDYQQYCINFIMQNKSCGLFLPCGLGKTLICLESLRKFKQTGRLNTHVLVVAPKNIARATWIDEIKKWGYNDPTDMYHLDYKSFIVNDKGNPISAAKRKELYKLAFSGTLPPTIWFINRDLIVNLVDYCIKEQNKMWPFGIVIIDEFQSFKTPTSKRFKALKFVRPAVSTLIGLSGTPTPQGPIDLWAEMYLIDGGKRLGKSFYKYRENYFHPTISVNNIPVNYVINAGAEDEIYKLIADKVISIKNPSIKLPPLTINDIHIQMSEDEYAIYHQMAQDQVVATSNNEVITAATKAVLQSKLSQLASGKLYTDEQHHYMHLHSHKTDMCEYIVNNNPTPVMICYWFNFELDELKARFPQAVVFKDQKNTSKCIADWNNNKIPVLLIQPASAGHGLNFQTGKGHTMIWYTLPWSLELYEQAIGRIYRQGQTSPVIIHRLLVDKTVDNNIARALSAKKFDQDKLLEEVRRDFTQNGTTN